MIQGLKTGLFINGEWVETSEKIDIRRPFDETPLASVSAASAEHVDQAVAAAKAAFPAWDALGPSGRKPYFVKFAALIREHSAELTDISCQNLGRDPHTAGWEVQIAANTMDYTAEAPVDLMGQTRLDERDKLLVEYLQPYGVVAAILPWNVPCALFAYKVSAALGAGNTLVLKSSEKAPLSCLKFAELAQKAGFPPGVLNIISGYGNIAGARMAEHPDIRKLSFTGSTATGRLIQKAAAQSNLKHVQLELGGKSPSIVFDDADLALAAKKLAVSITFIGGQACVASSRVLVQENVADEFLHLFKEALSAPEMASITEPTNITKGESLPPIVDGIQFKRVMEFIEEGKSQATPILGGGRRGSKGYFVEPTIFVGLPQDSRLIKEEIFGPVVCINTFKTEAEALALANDSEYGLYASVFTGNIGRSIRVSKGLEAGMVGVNTTSPEMAPGMAFGGWKSSGVGREGGKHGILDMLERKVVNFNYN